MYFDYVIKSANYSSRFLRKVHYLWVEYQEFTNELFSENVMNNIEAWNQELCINVVYGTKIKQRFLVPVSHL
jgi:hypothetical protein